MELSEVLAIAARMRCVEQGWFLEAERDGYSDAHWRKVSSQERGAQSL